ncbi:hypothetical protein TNCV_2016761 [Trichonephila clavipes]|nr:hypothetical protein TNCV_2016761 [Trichonephila clavipes]
MGYAEGVWEETKGFDKSQGFKIRKKQPTDGAGTNDLVGNMQMRQSCHELYRRIPKRVKHLRGESSPKLEKIPLGSLTS